MRRNAVRPARRWISFLFVAKRIGVISRDLRHYSCLGKAMELLVLFLMWLSLALMKAEENCELSLTVGFGRANIN